MAISHTHKDSTKAVAKKINFCAVFTLPESLVAQVTQWFQSLPWVALQAGVD
jgi:hypothetical protein